MCIEFGIGLPRSSGLCMAFELKDDQSFYTQCTIEIKVGQIYLSLMLSLKEISILCLIKNQKNCQFILDKRSYIYLLERFMKTVVLLGDGMGDFPLRNLVTRHHYK